MSTRRHRTHLGATRLASALLFIVCVSFSVQVATTLLADAATNSVSPSSPVQGDTKPSAKRSANRPRPAFWQGDTSLSEEQKAALQTFTQSYRQNNKAQLEALVRIRRELEELVFAKAPDSAAIQSKAMELAKTEGELAIARAELIQKVRPRLTPEQLERLKSLRGSFELSERFAARNSPTNRNTLPQRPRKRVSEPDASGSATPKE